MREQIFLITGATGDIGTEAVQLLARDVRRPRVRVARRDPRSSRAQLLEHFAHGQIEAVQFNVNDAQSLRQAFEGVTRLFVVAPLIEDMANWHAQVAAAAKASGTCDYVVKVSVIGARPANTNPPPGRFPSLHYQGEQAISSAGLALTTIRPNIFMQHFLNMPALYTAGDDHFYLPTGTTGIAFLDNRDIALMGVNLLWLEETERKQHVGQAYELTGPEAVTAQEIATILSEVAGRPVQHVDGSEAFVLHAEQLHVSSSIKAVYAEAAEGWFSHVETGPFATITGRRPRTFAQFACDHAAYFEPRLLKEKE